MLRIQRQLVFQALNIKIYDYGQCLYLAIANYLNIAPERLRMSVANHVELGLKEVHEILQIKLGNQFDTYTYTNDVRQGKECDANIQIEILMSMLKRPIVTICSNGRIKDLGVLEKFTGEPIFVYYNGNDHYDTFLYTGQILSSKLIKHLKKFEEITIFNRAAKR